MKRLTRIHDATAVFFIDNQRVVDVLVVCFYTTKLGFSLVLKCV